MDKIFISHSVKDRTITEYLVDLLESMGVPPDKIFCSSREGYGIPLGENFIERIREELNKDTLVLFVLSENFYRSPACLCEMGAVWVKSGFSIPILIPPFDFQDVRGLISQTQGLKINDKNKLNSLCELIRNMFNISGFDMNIWERKRDRFINDVNREISLLYKDTAQSVEGRCGEETQALRGRNMDAMAQFDILIKDVRDKLAKLPWIVRKGLYYHFSGRDFMLDQLSDEDEVDYAMKAAEDDYLFIDGKWITLNARDPKVKKAMESLDALKCFLETSGEEFHNEFENKYEICAKIESRKFWRMMEIL